MHELSIAQAILAAVEEVALAERFERVERIRLVVGSLTCLEAESLRFCFGVAARGTVAERARLEVGTEDALGRCGPCGLTVAVAALPAACPGCGAFDLALDGGHGVRLAELEVV